MDSRTHPAMFALLEPHWGPDIDHRAHCGSGWAEILRSFHHKAVKIDPVYQLLVAKQTWGELIINAGQHNFDNVHHKSIAEIAEQARLESTKICEWCGEPGELRELTLDRTLCDACKSAMSTSGGKHGRPIAT